MTDTKIQELAEKIQKRGLHDDDAAQIIEALSDLARIKGAALSVQIQEIEKRHQTFGELFRPTIGGVMEHAAHRDRATLLDALRAREAEFLAYWQRCKDVLGDERVSGRPICDCIADLIGELNDATRDRDTFSALNRTAEEERGEAREALAVAVYERDCDRERYVGQIAALRQQLAQAQKEIERLRGMLADLQQSGMAWRDEMRQRNLDLQEKLAQAERDKAEMRERIAGLTHYDFDVVHGMVREVSGDYVKADDVLALFDARDGEAENGQESKAALITNGGALPDGATISPAGPCSNCFGKAPTLELGNAGESIAICERCARGASDILAAHRDVKTGDA